MTEQRTFENIETGQYKSSLFETLKMSYRPYKNKIYLVIALGFLGRLVLLANANLLGAWVDRGLQDTTFYFSVLSVFCLLGLFSVWVFRVVFSRYSARAVSQLYDEVTWRTSRYPMSFFDQTPVGRVVTRFSSDYGNVFRLFGGPLAEFMAIVFDLLAMSILAIVAHPFFSVIVLAIGASNYFVYRVNRRKLRILRRQLSASRSPSIAHFAESAQGVTLIRVFNRYKVFSERFEKLDRFFLQNKMDSTKGIIFYSFQMNFLTALILLATGLASIFGVQSGWLTIGDVGVMFTFIVLSGNTIQMFFEWLAQLEEALVGVERLDQYLRLPLERGSQIPSGSQFPDTHPREFYSLDTDDPQPRPLQVGIDVENLYFRYHPQQDFVLKSLSFSILPGEKVGVIGRTGSGKSSLVQALFHLYPFDSGVIRIHGCIPKNFHQEPVTGRPIELQKLRSLMAYVPQETALFRGSLRQNLDLEHFHQEDSLRRALNRVGLGPWFKSLREGLDFKIEEKGKNLSLGERQLICLARASLKEAPMIILDEATSSIDPQTEDLVEKALRNVFNGKTQLIIAHRLSTLENCDRILWIHRGQLKIFDKPSVVLPLFHEADLAQLDLQKNL